MNAPQALIHGDLHFGSVFAKPDGVVVFDPEFCFFGPVGYDLGNLIAHFLLEACAADREIIGFDVVELAPLPGLHHADFTAAKLVHALMGLAQRSLRL